MALERVCTAKSNSALGQKFSSLKSKIPSTPTLPTISIPSFPPTLPIPKLPTINLNIPSPCSKLANTSSSSSS